MRYTKALSVRSSTAAFASASAAFSISISLAAAAACAAASSATLANISSPGLCVSVLIDRACVRASERGACVHVWYECCRLDRASATLCSMGWDCCRPRPCRPSVARCCRLAASRYIHSSRCIHSSPKTVVCACVCVCACEQAYMCACVRACMRSACKCITD